MSRLCRGSNSALESAALYQQNTSSRHNHHQQQQQQQQQQQHRLFSLHRAQLMQLSSNGEFVLIFKFLFINHYLFSRSYCYTI